MNKKKMHFRIPDLNVSFKIILYLLTIALCCISVCMTFYYTVPVRFGYMVYGLDVLAGILLVLSVLYIICGVEKFRHIILPQWINHYPFTKRIAGDYRYRTFILLYISLACNLIYAFINGIFGYVYSSWWFGTMSFYYIVLSSMRWNILARERRHEGEAAELKACRISGYLLCTLDIALAGSVVLVVMDDDSRVYPKFMIFAVAAYTFYKIILAVINLVHIKKIGSPLLTAVRCIGLADALMSLISLQTAMMTRFGKAGSMRVKLNAMTGGAACTIIMGISIYLIIKAGGNRRAGKLKT